MGFPVPLHEWFNSELSKFYADTMKSIVDNKRSFINHEMLLKCLRDEERFSRKSWALISLELWYQNYHDKSHQWKKKLNEVNF